jgi:hypothetical protein
MDETPRNVVDAIVRDAVEPQRQAGILPRVNEARSYVQGIVEKMDRKTEERRHRIIAARAAASAPHPTETSSTDALEREYIKRLTRRGETPLPGKWTVTRKPADPVKRDRRLIGEAEKRLRHRLRLLRSKPDWAKRLKRINPLALQGHLGDDKKRHAEMLVREVIDDSARVFGPWWKGAPTKIWSMPK